MKTQNQINEQIIKRVKKNAKKVNINNTKTWHATCDECGYRKMEYYNFRYCCPKCGYVLEV